MIAPATRSKPRWRSCIYEGVVRHRRYQPTRHDFRMPMFMMMLDLSELPKLFDRRLLWSARRAAPAWFRRADFMGDPEIPLDEAVRNRVEQETGSRPTGPIRLLTHLRYLGYSFNPVSFYYCECPDGSGVESIVAEITNTPWKERHAYVLPRRDSIRPGASMRFHFDKQFHVSPFMPMDQRYDWTFTEPGGRLAVHMRNEREGRVFDATLAMRRVELTGASLARALTVYPAMTMQVIARIHFEALRLWLKKVPVVPHPGRSRAARRQGDPA